MLVNDWVWMGHVLQQVVLQGDGSFQDNKTTRTQVVLKRIW